MLLIIFSFTYCRPQRFDPITSEELYEHAAYLAADELIGREIGEPGITAAEEYIANAFKESGLSSLPGQNDFFINFDLYEYYLDLENTTLEITIAENVYDAIPGISFRPLYFSGMGSIETEVVFAGYGITSSTYSWDDYESLDVEGKLVLVLRHEPENFHSANPEGEISYTTHATFKNKMENAIGHGAAGMILFTDPLFSNANDDLSITNSYSLNPEDIALMLRYANDQSDKNFAVYISNTYASFIIHDSLGMNLLELQEAVDSGIKPYEFESKEINAKLCIQNKDKPRQIKVRNVAGILKGSTFPFSNEWIVIGAHHDHVGFFEGAGDTIYNGADDNASGVAGVLELAEAYASSPEKLPYNIVFITFSAEEKGLFGSEYFTNLYSDIDIKYMINLDMIGRNPNKHFTIYQSNNNIDNIINIINDSKPIQDLSYNVKLSGNDAYSDDYNFYENGIPTIFFFSGYHDDYHGVGDHSNKLDYKHMQLITEFAYNIVHALTFNEPSLKN